MAVLQWRPKVINYRRIEEICILMRNYSYLTVSTIINAFEKSVNFHFKIKSISVNKWSGLWPVNQYRKPDYLAFSFCPDRYRQLLYAGSRSAKLVF